MRDAASRQKLERRVFGAPVQPLHPLPEQPIQIESAGESEKERVAAQLEAHAAARQGDSFADSGLTQAMFRGAALIREARATDALQKIQRLLRDRAVCTSSEVFEIKQILVEGLR
jgi:hypothetical protein